jgi:hypothetical protein
MQPAYGYAQQPQQYGQQPQVAQYGQQPVMAQQPQQNGYAQQPAQQQYAGGPAAGVQMQQTQALPYGVVDPVKQQQQVVEGCGGVWRV